MDPNTELMSSVAQKCKFQFFIRQCRIDGIKFPCNYFIEIKTGNNKSLLTRSSKSVLSIDNVVSFNEALLFEIEIIKEKDHNKYILSVDETTKQKSFQNINLKKNRQLTLEKENSPVQILILLNLTSTRKPDQIKLVGRYTFNLNELIIGHSSSQTSFQRKIKLDYSSVNAYVVFTPKIINISKRKFNYDEINFSKDLSGLQDLLGAMDGEKSGFVKSKEIEKQASHSNHKILQENSSRASSKIKDPKQEINLRTYSQIQKDNGSTHKYSETKQEEIQNRSLRSTNKEKFSEQSSPKKSSDVDMSEKPSSHITQNQQTNRYSSKIDQSDQPSSHYSTLLQTAQRRQRQIWSAEKSLFQQQIASQKRENEKLKESIQKAEKKAFQYEILIQNQTSQIQNLKRQQTIQLKEKQNEKKSKEEEIERLMEKIKQIRHERDDTQMLVRKKQSEKVDLQRKIRELESDITIKIQRQSRQARKELIQTLQREKLQQQSLLNKLGQYQKNEKILQGKIGEFQNLYKILHENHQNSEAALKSEQLKTKKLTSEAQHFQQEIQKSNLLIQQSKQYATGLQESILAFYEQKREIERKNDEEISRKVMEYQAKIINNKQYTEGLESNILMRHQQNQELRTQIKTLTDQLSKAKEETYSRDYIEGLQIKILEDYNHISKIEKEMLQIREEKKEIEDELEVLRHSYEMNEEEYRSRAKKLTAQIQRYKKLASSSGSAHPISKQSQQFEHLISLKQEELSQLKRENKQLLTLLESKSNHYMRSPEQKSFKMQDEDLLALQDRLNEKEEYIFQLQNNLSEKAQKIETLEKLLSQNLVEEDFNDMKINIIEVPSQYSEDKQEIQIEFNFVDEPKVRIFEVKSEQSGQEQMQLMEDRVIEEQMAGPEVRVFEVKSEDSGDLQKMVIDENQDIQLHLDSFVKGTDQQKRTDSEPPSLPPNLKKNQEFDDLQDLESPNKKRDKLTRSDKFKGGIGGIGAMMKIMSGQVEKKTEQKDVSEWEKAKTNQKNSSSALNQANGQKVKLEALAEQYKKRYNEFSLLVKKYQRKLTLLKQKQTQLIDAIIIIEDESNNLLHQLNVKDNKIEQLVSVIKKLENGQQILSKMTPIIQKTPVSPVKVSIKEKEELNSLKKKVEDLQKQLKVSNEQLLVNKRLILSMRDKESSKIEKKEGENENIDKFYEIMKLNAKIEELEEELFSYQSSDNYNEIRIQQITEQNNQLVVINTQLSKQIEILRREKAIIPSPKSPKNSMIVEKVEKEKIMLTEKINQLHEQATHFQTKITSLEVQLLQKQEKNEQLENLLKEERKQYFKVKRAYEDSINTRPETKILKTVSNESETSSLRILQEEVHRVSQLLQEKNAEHEATQQNNEILSARINSLELQIIEKNSAIQYFQSKYNSIAQELDDLRKNNKDSFPKFEEAHSEQVQQLQQELEFIKSAFEQAQEQNNDISNRLKIMEIQKERLSLQWEEKQFENMNNELELQLKLQQQENNMKRSINASNRSNRDQSPTYHTDILAAAKILKQCIQKKNQLQVQENTDNPGKLVNLLNSPTPSGKSDQNRDNQAQNIMQENVYPISNHYLGMLISRITFSEQQLMQQQSTISLEAIRAVMIEKSRMVSMQLSKSKTEVMRMKVQHSDRLLMLQLFKPIDTAIKGLVQTAENLGNEQLANLIQHYQKQTQQRQ